MRPLVGIGAFLGCLAVAGGGLALLHRSGVVAASKTSSAPRSTDAPIHAKAPISAAGAAASQPPAAAVTHLVTASASIPSGTNIAAADFGGEIESITGSYGPGHTGRFLIDGS